MRVENQNVNGLSGTGSSDSVRSINTGVSAPETNEDKSSDTVRLSSASSLIALARGLNWIDKQSRVADLTTQFRSGSYEADPIGASRALVADQTK